MVCTCVTEEAAASKEEFKALLEKDPMRLA